MNSFYKDVPQMEYKHAFHKFMNMKFKEYIAAHGGRATVSEFAEFLGQAQADVSHWLNGDRIPRAEPLERLAKVLGEEVYEASGRLDAMIGNPAIRETLKRMAKLPRDQQEAIARQVEAWYDAQEENEPGKTFQYQTVSA